MTNHLKPPKKTQLRPYFSESLILQGFQPPKNANFGPFFPHFLHILVALPLSQITKKR